MDLETSQNLNGDVRRVVTPKTLHEVGPIENPTEKQQQLTMGNSSKTVKDEERRATGQLPECKRYRKQRQTQAHPTHQTPHRNPVRST